MDPKIDVPKMMVPPDPDQDLTIKANFMRYDSPFVQGMIPLLMTRYAHLGLESINPFNFLRKPAPIAPKTPFDPKAKVGFGRYLSLNFSALSMGTLWTAALAFYSKRTYDDIKTLYSEAVGYELGKNKEEVTWRDLLFKSQNAALGVTQQAYVKRSLSRLAAFGSFFVPWHKLRGLKDARPKYSANADVGVGVVGTYLGIYEGFLRRPSFFDVEQKMLGTAINHADALNLKIIQPQDIQSLLFLQRTHLNRNYKAPDFNSSEGQNEEKVTERIADLMNQTYNNKPHTEPANFTIGKFNYLVGFGLLDAFPTSLAFVELANKSTTMEEVKQAASAIRSGQAPQAVFQQFGIELAKPASKLLANAPAVEPSTGKFVENLSAKKAMPQAQRTHQDFAMDKTGPQQAI